MSFVYEMSRTHIVYLYNSVSRLVLKEGAHVKYELLEQITRCWVGQDNKEDTRRVQSDLRTRPGWTYLREAARDSCSSMYNVYRDYNVVICLEKVKERSRMLNTTCVIDLSTRCCILSVWLICLFFCRLKTMTPMSLFFNSALLQTLAIEKEECLATF